MQDIFIILLGLSMIYISSTSRLNAHINMLIVQGFLLFFICLSGIIQEGSQIDNFNRMAEILFIVVETIIVKALVIPYILKKVLHKTCTRRDSDANIPHFYALVISSIILFLGFMTANIKTAEFDLITPLYFGVSIAVIITSLWLITIKKTVLSNIISFVTMENGIFLLSLSIASKMPIIVNLGVLLDIFIAVFVLSLLVREINSEFSDLDVSGLSELKDYE